jgi:glucose-6-phosphate 1-dehydrogenase
MEGTMTELQADAIVLFGATGDLAFKKIFPALQAMIKQNHLTVPVIGVAKGNQTFEQLRDRVHESLRKFGGGVDEAAFAKLVQLLRYVDGDYREEETFVRIRQELGAAPSVLSGDPAQYVSHGG